MKYLPVKYYRDICKYPNIHKSGSIMGMRRLYGWKYIVRCGNYYYNVDKKFYDSVK